MKAIVHPQESQRLGALDVYGILDTPAESEYDEIVVLARDICDAPIALISFVEADRQWFKARIGFDRPETPIEQSICAHAIASDNYLEIPDTLADPRTIDNPLCVKEGVRFYAGALLRNAAGVALGTLCVIDKKPRRLTQLQRSTLVVLANQVVRQMDLQASLQREGLLRQEIDHRVKNSLMSISAMVRMKKAKASVPATQALLGDVERSIELVALLHSELYKASVAEKIDICQLLGSIGTLMREALPDPIALTVDCDPLVLSSGQATAIAYIVNEFVANSQKHAFAEGREGEIAISLIASGDARYVLACSDNGGVAIDFDPEAEQGGIGLKIIKGCARQLNATIEWQVSDQGFGLTLAWPAR